MKIRKAKNDEKTTFALRATALYGFETHQNPFWGTYTTSKLQIPLSILSSHGSPDIASRKALPGFEPGISCLLDRRFNR